MPCPNFMLRPGNYPCLFHLLELILPQAKSRVSRGFQCHNVTPILGTALAAPQRTLSTRHAPGNARGSISWNAWATALARSTRKRFHALPAGRTWTSNCRPSRAPCIRCCRNTKPPCGMPISVSAYTTKAGTPLPSVRVLTAPQPQR